MIILTGIRSFIPLTKYGDAAAFYLVLPKLLAANQKWSLLAGFEAFSTIGIHGELHYAALMALGSSWGAKLFNWPISISCAAGLAALGSKLGVGKRGQWLIIIMVFTSTAFAKLIGNGKVDIFAAAMGVAAIYWVFQEYNKSSGAEIILSGLFAGFAIIAKISYLTLIVPCMLLLITWQGYYSKNYEKSRLRYFNKSILLFGAGMLIPILVHLLKNWVLFHEPFAPFFYFSENYFKADWTYQNWISFETIKKLILTYPFALCYGKYPFQTGTMSKLYLAFAPLILLIPKKKKLIQNRMFQITFIGIMGIVIWTAVKPGVFAPRYILYTLLLLTPIIAGATEYIIAKNNRKSCITVSVVCACIVCLISANLSYANRIKHRIKKPVFDAPVYVASKIMNKSAKPGDRVFSANYYTYWYSTDLLRSMYPKDDTLDYDEKSSHKNWKFLYNHGYRFIFINKLTHESLVDKLNLKQIPEKLKVKVIFNEKDIIVYHLTSRN